MDWKDVAHVVAPLAPVLGGVLGGFIPIPGGALAGQAVGNLIASAFGVDPASPTAAGDTLAKINELKEQNRHAEIIANLEAATQKARAEIDGFVEVEKAYLHAVEVTSAQVNTTMRAEIGHESFYFNGWRAACGWILAFYLAAFGAILMVAGVDAAWLDKPQPLKTLTDAWPIFLAFFGVLGAVVGVYVVARSQTQSKAIEAGVIPASIGGKPPPAQTTPVPTKPVLRAPVPLPDRHAPA